MNSSKGEHKVRPYGHIFCRLASFRREKREREFIGVGVGIGTELLMPIPIPTPKTQPESQNCSEGEHEVRDRRLMNSSKGEHKVRPYFSISRG
jgi:hypothetical protein